jgi:antitoxin VapB
MGKIDNGIYRDIYCLRGAKCKLAKLFQNGRSQAVRLPKEYQFEGTEVLIQKVGDSVPVPEKSVWETFLHGLYGFTDDYMADGREQPQMQEREGL